ncbi:MAG: isocitrate lyase/PEP mutase family protein [Anaerotruncus sp.]|nr:isocitrate lyase/PEP mutase family protein [Anaerotruncus sp.]
MASIPPSRLFRRGLGCCRMGARLCDAKELPTHEENDSPAERHHGAPGRRRPGRPRRPVGQGHREAPASRPSRSPATAWPGRYLGKPDVGLVRMKDVLDLTWNIAQAVTIPVMADVDTGGGNAVNAAWITERLIAMGVAGMNIEDQVFPKRCGHMAGKEVISAEEMAGKVRACADVRDRLDKDFIINARTDVFAGLGLDEAIRRCNLYLEAGADLAFIDGIKSQGRHREGGQVDQGPAVGQPHGRHHRHEDRAASPSPSWRRWASAASPSRSPRSWSPTRP